MSPLRPAVFLDRDGTLNAAVVRDGRPYPPATVEEFSLLPGVVEACESLHTAGFALVVVTNQPDVGRGTQRREMVEAIHARMCGLLPIERVEVSYDAGGENPPSEFRKPRPGMLLSAARDLGLDLTRSWMIGDRWRDIDCGAAAGVRTVFIDWAYDEKLRAPPDFKVANLTEAAAIVLAHIPPRKLNPSMLSLNTLKVQIYADGADKAGILDLYAKPYVKGLTTNPTLMKKAGIKDYEAFAKDILQTVTAKPISLEVFSDEFPEMRRQAAKIASWGKNVYVKIPITNSRGESSIPLIAELAKQGVQLNITALLTLAQVRDVAAALNSSVPSVVSVFAGRIADTGRDPVPLIRAAGALLEGQPKAELLWASVREVLNIIQAEEAGCAIVTVPHDILAKASSMFGMDLGALSLDTVKMFARDATAAGYKL